MAYLIEGLSTAPYSALFAMSDPELESHGARRVRVDARPGFPCRATLEDAQEGETVMLVNHVSNDVPGPFRASFAIYVREQAGAPARFRDELPPALLCRTLSLRGFDARGDLRAARLASADDADASIRAMLDDSEIAFINAHSAAAGCFVARIVRD